MTDKKHKMTTKAQATAKAETGTTTGDEMKKKTGQLDGTLLEKVAEAKRNGKKVGLVQGSWDLFHLGHLRYILKARELCDFLIIAMDSDEKIRKRKGPSRPVIPEGERYEFIKLLGIADGIVIKQVGEPKWHLIKTVRPDILVAIKENYTDEQIEQLKEFCGKVAILPRQAKTSTSDKIRKITIASRARKLEGVEGQVEKAIEEIKQRINLPDDAPEVVHRLLEEVRGSTDGVCPTAAACFWDGEWKFGTNQVDANISEYDIQNRTELFYATTEHAEMNLLKKLGKAKLIDVPIWVILFPCDDCMKVLANKGVKEIYYLEDHPERNWSKRSHALAKEKGIKTICLNRNLTEAQNDTKAETKKITKTKSAKQND